MDIYWIEKGMTKQRKGPLPLVEIVSMMERGDVSPETRGWHAGCDAWLPLNELPALKSYFEKKALKEEELQAIERHIEHVERPDIRVFIAPPLGLRFWARLFDVVLYLLIYFSVIRFFTNEFSLNFFTWWIGFPMPLLEACSLALWGTTPGKFLMKLQVRSCIGEKLNFSTAIKRSFYVFFFGTGMMMTMFTPIFVALSWWYTKKNGISQWDRRVGSIVEVKNAFQKGIPGIAWRVILSALLVFLMLDLMGMLLSEWLPAMEAAFRQAGM